MTIDISPQREKVELWEGWLGKCFPPAHIARARAATDGHPDEAVWHVEFQDGKLGRIHVTPAALEVSAERFRRITRRLRRTDWYAYLDQMICIRIHPDGSISDVR